MVKKEKKIKIEGYNNAFIAEEHYEDEAISKNILTSINDFYNLMHLIKKAWSNKKYYLKMEDAGYNIYDKNNDLSAWVGIKEKCDSIMYIIYSYSKIFKKAYKNHNGPMVIYDYDEDLWIFSELKITKIIKETNIEKQKKIIKNWINKEIKNIL